MYPECAFSARSQLGEHILSPPPLPTTVKDLVLESSQHISNRLTVSYPSSGGNHSEGAKILQQHGSASSERMTSVSLSFASTNLKERFLGRIRALTLGFKGTDPDSTLPLPSGENLSILTATWNVGDRKPPTESLEDWLPAGQHDVYAIGFQECKDKKKWFKGLQDHLCGEGARTKVRRSESQVTSQYFPD